MHKKLIKSIKPRDYPVFVLMQKNVKIKILIFSKSVCDFKKNMLTNIVEALKLKQKERAFDIKRTLFLFYYNRKYGK